MMKTFSLIMCLISMLAPSSAGDYACMENGAVLYSYDGGVYTEIAQLPKSYFVTVLESGADGYKLVSYLDTVGYMKESELSTVDYIPKYKHADLSFTVSNDSQPANLRRKPTKGDSDNIVAVMPDGGGGKIIGTIRGDELIAGAGDLWYYVRFKSGDALTYGYVYGAHISADEWTPNTGEREQNIPNGISGERGDSTFEMSFATRIVMIVSLCLPLIVAMFMLRKKKGKSEPTAKEN